MADVFPPIDIGTPDWGFKVDPDANVEVTTLGDGYESREPIGLHHIRDEMSPTWSNLDPLAAQEAYEFLRERLKWKAVLWDHPVTQVQLRVVPQSVSLEWDTWNNGILSVTFKTDVNPG